MLRLRSCEAKPQCEDVGVKEQTLLTPERVKNVENWVKEQERSHGKLEKEVFIKAVCGLASGNQNDNHFSFLACFSSRNIVYGPAVLLFNFGGLWALLAVNAMNERFQIRHDIDQQQIGTLNSIYFVAGIFGPFIGGFIMDHYAGPGLVACGSTSITTIGAVLQWLANTPERYTLLLVGRFLIGFGHETTMITSYEVVG
jgi:predicted MFS family arabinose efflux permease